jgi:hypothetical protein
MIHPPIDDSDPKTRLELAIPAIVASLFAGYSVAFLTVLRDQSAPHNYLLRNLVPTREIITFAQAYPHTFASGFLSLTIAAAWAIFRWARTQRRFRNFTSNFSEFHFLILALVCGALLGWGSLLGLQALIALQPFLEWLAGAVLIASWLVISICTFPWAMGFTMLFSLWVVIGQIHYILRGI